MMDTEQQTFADLCREQREQRYETYQGMADLIGVHWRTFYRWEEAKSLPRRAEARRFAQRCKVPLAIVKDAIKQQQVEKHLS